MRSGEATNVTNTSLFFFVIKLLVLLQIDFVLQSFVADFTNELPIVVMCSNMPVSFQKLNFKNYRFFCKIFVLLQNIKRSFGELVKSALAEERTC